MNKVLTKYSISIITILFANLIGEVVMAKLFDLCNSNDYNSVIIRMSVIIIVFVPTFTILEKYAQRFSKGYINTSKKTTKNSLLGLIIGVTLGLVTLTISYGYVWYSLLPW